MMLEGFQPGSVVQVKIVKRPTNEAARKTLIRVLSTASDVKSINSRLRKLRRINYRPSMRGGRLYGGRMHKLQPVKTELGTAKTLTATPTVLTDLHSVRKFIEVTAA